MDLRISPQERKAQPRPDAQHDPGPGSATFSGNEWECKGQGVVVPASLRCCCSQGATEEIGGGSRARTRGARVLFRKDAPALLQLQRKRPFTKEEERTKNQYMVLALRRPVQIALGKSVVLEKIEARLSS
jgi:hypothetical protein